MGETVKIGALADHDGAQSEAMGETYSREWRKAARLAVSAAIRVGALIRPASCSSCGAIGAIHAHHTSYALDHWLKVEWLCLACHAARHAGVWKSEKWTLLMADNDEHRPLLELLRGDGGKVDAPFVLVRTERLERLRAA